MKDKYYKPNIEEFHVDFEFGYTHEEDWFENIISDAQEISAFYYDKSTDIRVKYLDREDIEELGWKFVKVSAGTTENYFELENTEWCLDFNPDFRGRIHVRIYEECEGDNTFFSGTIKNKSELKRIMQQVGVIDGK